MINDTVPVNTADIGFAKVREHTEGNFALIHDAARIKYEVYNDCDLVEIGEAFADQPYALAVQQGSHLQVQKTFFLILMYLVGVKIRNLKVDFKAEDAWRRVRQ